LPGLQIRPGGGPDVKLDDLEAEGLKVVVERKGHIYPQLLHGGEAGGVREAEPQLGACLKNLVSSVSEFFLDPDYPYDSGFIRLSLELQ